MLRTALFSPDHTYRYLLTRTWADGPTILWLMLNPSTADEHVDDPTIRRCIAFSRAWGYGAMTAVNLFALRTPDPGPLRRHQDPIGPENDAHIAAAAARAGQIIAAWGAFPFAADQGRALDVLLSRSLHCLGCTASGAPRHPLYAPSTARLRPYRPSGQRGRSVAAAGV